MVPADQDLAAGLIPKRIHFLGNAVQGIFPARFGPLSLGVFKQRPAQAIAKVVENFKPTPGTELASIRPVVGRGQPAFDFEQAVVGNDHRRRA